MQTRDDSDNGDYDDDDDDDAVRVINDHTDHLKPGWDCWNWGWDWSCQVKSSQVKSSHVSLCVLSTKQTAKNLSKKRETVRKAKRNLFASGVLILFSKFLLIQIKKCIKVVTKLMFEKTQHQLLKNCLILWYKQHKTKKYCKNDRCFAKKLACKLACQGRFAKVTQLKGRKVKIIKISRIYILKLN